MISKNSNQLQVVEVFDFCEIRKDDTSGHLGLFSRKNFSMGDLVINFGSSEILDTPNYLTVQISETKHIHLFPEYLQYVNHCCEPNVLFNTMTMQLECIADIEAGDELRFFYPATEWKIAQQFVCNCGKPSCIGLVQGAADTSSEVLNKYKLTDFIKSMAAQYKAFLLIF
jgi:hypothetical protein